MLRKDRFITTWSKSTTNEGTQVSIQFVKGVGPKLGAVFQSRQIDSVGDLLFFFPRAYQDRSRLFRVADLQEGVQATVQVQVISHRKIPARGKFILEVRCGDASGDLKLKWFHPPWGMEKKFVTGAQLKAVGQVKLYMGIPEIVHPEIIWSADHGTVGLPDTGRVIPIYIELDGIPSRTFRKVLWEALEKYGKEVQEFLPAYLLQRRNLPLLSTSVQALHFPPESAGYSLLELAQSQTPAHQRLIYGEFFRFEYLMLRRRFNLHRVATQGFGRSGGREKVAALIPLLPYQLTSGQIQAITEIQSDLDRPVPMNRLVQGDVGSGKTIVALLSAVCVLAEGGQVALMVPTEILAEQHYKSTLRLFGDRIALGLLTGKTPTAERNRIQARLTAREPLLLIGTHALLEDPVQFTNLRYVLIDEQHRFGVEQRRKLKQKGIFPHSLILTATPIPRTLALTAFGDLDVTVIRDRPAGRMPIATQVVRTAVEREKVYQKIRLELEAGRQAYFIYPLVNESEAEGFTHLKAATLEAEVLARRIFPEYPLGLLHGQMTSDEKTDVMERFQQGRLKILVSTTVIEVGVDVPNSTVMVVEHADRFGLSQLHQLRGRVGRGQFQSFCYLLTHQKKEGSAHRLEVLEESNDGFKIAEADLEIRGPGEFLGTRQAGGLPFRLADLARDSEWLLKAREDALEVVQKDPALTLPQHGCLRNYYQREGSLQFDRLNTS